MKKAEGKVLMCFREMLEEQVWLSAAQNILSQNGGNPMHYTDIKRLILERNLVSVR